MSYRHDKKKARLCSVVSAALLVTASLFSLQSVSAQGVPEPTFHSQQAHDPASNFTARWTRADARQIQGMSDLNVPTGQNSMPSWLTMPDIPADFPQTNSSVWVWDTWPLADFNANQISFRGWEVIFSLTADQSGGYSFDDRHTHARIGYFYRRAGIPARWRPRDGGWIYGGHVFPDGSSVRIFGNIPLSQNAEWSGSARLLGVDGRVSVYYTALAFNRNANDEDITPSTAIIARTDGRIMANRNRVWFSGFNDHLALLRPDGVYYQTGAQNPYYNFRDPFPFLDPAHPGKVFMVFEGNSAVERGARACTEADLGYAANDPEREDLEEVMDSGAVYQMANVGLAVATNRALTRWKFLPPILSANCVNDQTERPQIYFKDGKRYLFTITHRSTYAAGMDGPDGVMGFVGNGIRSDFQPMNAGSGLVLGNPTDLNSPVGEPYALDPDQNPRTFQSYSHYVMPGGLVTSFIDAIGTRRGGAYAPTVRIKIRGASSSLDTSYGTGGLGGYGDIPSNLPFPWNFPLSRSLPSLSGRDADG
ncbi:glycoside hydrolase family 68 protein [Pseudoxanthomonas sp.]|uniref:glycoside hydrolase family 68 protein n=1 Tax=Pseudoxanthomonas sp. TaxID=1871049 RepID=UPI0026302147|nr:glycoside hydrolase family 68 protein [Pseudoxanthomonas sp.]WDS37136.1 MAG: glycoside hydrolase family 68 protein [Pseudoxanthomonas sp.]